MRFRLLLGGVAAAALAYTVLWFVLANAAKEELATRRAALDRAGIDNEIGSVAVGGFPYRIALALKDVTLADPRGAPPWRLQLPELDVYTHPWTPGHLVARAPDTDIRLGTLRLEAPEAMASWRGGAGESDRLDIAFGAVAISGASGESLRAGGLELHLRLRGAAASAEEEPLYGAERAGLAIGLRDLALGRWAADAPEPAVSRADLRVAVTGPLSPPVDAKALAAWRDAGGTLEIESLEVVWGEVRLSASGSLALDEAMRPLGALTLRSERPRAVLEYLIARGLVERDAVPMLPGVLGALEEAGVEGPLELPLTLQDGRAWLGPLAIALLTPLVGN